jgi:hypothetical protein
MQNSESGPKPRYKFTPDKAALQLIYETQLGIYQLIWTNLERADPQLAPALKPSYEEFIKVVLEIMKEDLNGELSTLKEAQKRIPENPWPLFFQEYGKSLAPSSEEEKDKVSKEFKENVAKRIIGRDIN